MRRQDRPRPTGPVMALESRALMTIAAAAPLPDLTTAAGSPVAAVQLANYFKDSAPASNYAIFDTSLGTIPVLLTPSTTPKTVANFLTYANSGAYTNSVVHRSVPGFIWQAGGYQLNSSGQVAAIPANSPVVNEFGASNVRGTIAMAKLGSDPNSATNQFFFNEADNSANLDKQNSGFTVFGRVVGDRGLAVMDAVGNVPVPTTAPMASPLDSAPLLNYTSGKAVQPANLVLIKGVTTAAEAFQAVSDAPAVATTAVDAGGNLSVTPLAAGTAHVTVTGFGSDGLPAAETFTVNVGPGGGATATTATGTASTSDSAVNDPGRTSSGRTPTTSTSGGLTVAHPSFLTPTSKGVLPASVVAGKKARIQQQVSLFALAGNVNQKERVDLKLSGMTAGAAGEVTIASVSKKLKVSQGVATRVTVAANGVKAGTPAGTYHVLVSVTDPQGWNTTIDTGQSLTVVAAAAKPGKK